MRKIIVVLLVLCAKIAQAQIYIDSYRFAQAGPANLLLDDYPGAAAAYSLRKLDKDYTGAAIRIRTAGGSETDIGFDSNGNLNTAAITTFCAGTTCTVTTWYDQSGNGRNATQATAANQPTIYTGGAVVTVNSKPAIRFSDAVNTILHGAFISKTTSNTAFSVAQRATTQLSTFDFMYNFNFDRTYTTSVPSMVYSSNSGVISTTPLFNNQILETINYSSSAFYARNGSILSTGSLTVNSGSGAFSIGNNTFDSAITFAFDGRIQEIIYYPTNQSTNRTNIETNINSYYSIY